MNEDNKKNFDSELQTYFGAIKQSIKEEHINYIKSHPELSQILNDFLSSCLLNQPEDVYAHAKEYFSYFNYHKDIQKFKPLVISGCSGVGKGTLIKFLLQKYPNVFELSISYTTRRPRQGEKHAREYYFVAEEEFNKEIEKGVFAEHFKVHGNMYGTHMGKLNEIINRGKICLLDIDLNGGDKIHSSPLEANFLFINAPSFQILEERLRSRGTETPEVIEKRLTNAKEELARVQTMEYYDRMENGDLESSKKNLVEYINKLYGITL